MNIHMVLLAGLLLAGSGCSSMYYGAMEKVGVHKRDIMTDRVKAARDAQHEGKEQFLSAMEQYKQVVQFQGGDLEKEYNKLNRVLEKSEAKATEIHERIEAVDDVSSALFKEWRAEIKQYTSDSLRKSSQQKYDATFAKYKDLIAAMRKAESKIEPVLVPLRDQVLFMKHNLNAKAIAGLSGELASVEGNVGTLIAEMEKAIAQADTFVAALQTN